MNNTDSTNSPEEIDTKDVRVLESPRLSIKFNGKFKSIGAFDWSDIPEFAIITGINGTGKSQLLQLLFDTVTDSERHSERVVFEGKTIGRHQVTFLKGEWELSGTEIIGIAEVMQSRRSQYQSFQNIQGNPNLKKNQIKLYEAFQIVIKRTGKEPSEISLTEFEENFPQVFTEHESHLSSKIGELFAKYRLDEINLLAQQMDIARISEKLGDKPWDVMRRILETAKLPFDINDPSTHWLTDSFQLKLTDRISNDEVSFSDLSSGEKVLMSLVFYLYTSKGKGIFPRLLLLDEPDAHLHPSMSQVFIDVMKKVLVDELGVQVVMTTHSPSTVALAPEECIFVASRVGDRIQKSTKDSALKLLTAGVPSFSVNYENRRQVFVESKFDVQYYEKIYRRIIEYLEPDVSLTFISSGESRTNSSGMPVTGCDQVVNITNKLRDAGNKFVWGLVDWDLSRETSEYVKTLGNKNRYSIENYLFDPLLIAALLLHQKYIERSDLKLDASATYADFKYYDEFRLQEIANYIINRIQQKVGDSSNDIVSQRLANGKTIDIPKWYIHLPGHELEDKILDTFPELNGIKKGKEEALKCAIVDLIIDDIPELISEDFITVFRILQAVA